MELVFQQYDELKKKITKEELKLYGVQFSSVPIDVVKEKSKQANK